MARPDSYSPLQKTLHWITAAAVLAMIPLGLYMVRQYVATSFDAATQRLYDIHKLIGFLLLWVIVLRLGVRLAHGVPADVPSLNPLQRLAAHTVHYALYVLLLVVPVLGWIGASAYDLHSLPLGLRLPAVAAHDEDYAYLVLWWHGWLAIGIGALAALHIGAALLHALVLKDGVFQRMWPSRRPH